MDYNKLTLEECFVYYHTGKIACECNADEKVIIFCKDTAWSNFLYNMFCKNKNNKEEVIFCKE